MNVFDAAHRVGHEYPGGAGALALRMGVGHAVFNSKLNPNVATHHLTLSESVRMQELAGRFDILHAMAATLGFICVPAGAFDDVSDEALLDAFTKVVMQLGDFTRTFHEAMADGKVERHELAKIKSCFCSLQQAGAELISRVESFADLSDVKARGRE